MSLIHSVSARPSPSTSRIFFVPAPTGIAVVVGAQPFAPGAAVLVGATDGAAEGVLDAVEDDVGADDAAEGVVLGAGVGAQPASMSAALSAATV
ncbi:MAG TPA: hypothetical protein VGI56_01805 [Galbitalea sp.]